MDKWLRIIMTTFLWVAVAIFLLGFTWISCEIIRDAASFSEIPEETTVNLDNLPTFLPREVKYFSVSNGKKGWILQYRFNNLTNLQISWWATIDYPVNRGYALYKPMPNSFRIENDVLTLKWERIQRNLLVAISIMIFISTIMIFLAVFLTNMFLRKS